MFRQSKLILLICNLIKLSWFISFLIFKLFNWAGCFSSKISYHFVSTHMVDYPTFLYGNSRFDSAKDWWINHMTWKYIKEQQQVLYFPSLIISNYNLTGSIKYNVVYCHFHLAFRIWHIIICCINLEMSLSFDVVTE